MDYYKIKASYIKRRYLEKVLFVCFLLHFLGGVVLAEPVKIGVILPLTGAFARYGQKIQESITQLKSDKVQFIFEDEACDAKVAVTAYTKLANLDGVKLFLGPWCGSPQSAIAPRIKGQHQISILGSSAPKSVFLESGGRMFSTQHSIEAESTFLAHEVSRLGSKSVVIVFLENQFSRAHEAAFRSSFTGNVMETFAYTSNDISQLKAIALKIRALNPDAIYAPDAYPLMGGLAKELSAIGVKEKRIYSVYSAQFNDVLEAMGKDGERLVYSYPKIDPDTALERFPKQAATILLNAVEKCGENDACVMEKFKRDQQFDSDGVVIGGNELVLKTIRNGKFERLGSG